MDKLDLKKRLIFRWQSEIQNANQIPYNLTTILSRLVVTSEVGIGELVCPKTSKQS
jgi:hypothetical protein